MKLKINETPDILTNSNNSWKSDYLYNLATWVNGRAFRTKEFSKDGLPVIKISELKNGLTSQTNYSNLTFQDKYYLSKGDLLFSWSGQPETSIDAFWYQLPDGWLNQHIFKVIPSNNIEKEFLFYLLKFKKNKFIQICRNKQTTGLGHVTVKDLKELEVEIPPVDERERIVNILLSLDNKIELNRKMNETLEETGKRLFKHWFVDFEFPNDKGKPYKSSGGEMVDSELEEIPKGWKISTVGKYLEIFDSKRIPLSSRERQKRQGNYRYYGATGVIDYVNDYLFDGIYLLLGEDGTVTRDKGYPYTQYVWGQFWVNNHAHVLQGKPPFSTEFMKLFFNTTIISSYVTGAVQPKLNQTNLKSIPFMVPDTSLVNKFESVITLLFNQLRNNEDEINSLQNIRDSLLPRLMSGKLRVN